MSKLLEALALLPESELEEIVGTHFGNMLFGLVTTDSREEELENLKVVNALRVNPLVLAMSEESQADLRKLFDSAESLLSIDDASEDEDD
jgi:hypothetical protein